MDINEYWENLVEAGIATDEELKLVTAINGNNEQTLDDVLYVRTGYRNWRQYTTYELEVDV